MADGRVSYPLQAVNRSARARVAERNGMRFMDMPIGLNRVPMMALLQSKASITNRCRPRLEVFWVGILPTVEAFCVRSVISL